MQRNKCGNTDDDDIYKDVVIIGNGPSGITLSYMLAGNWPYYTGEPHPSDEMLTARLHYSIGTQTCLNDCRESENNSENVDEVEDERRKSGRRCCSCHRKRKKSISLAHLTRDNLECLASGLEGRRGRPLSLLMDQLQHPCVDTGMDIPPLLSWRSQKLEPDHKVIDHVVLGKGPAGGAWHVLDPNVLTISLNRWMSLPGLDLRQWEKLEETKKQRNFLFPGDRLDQEKITATKAPSRVTTGTVALYYKDYVAIHELEQYFRCGTTVTSVRPVVGASVSNNKEYGWIVEGFENKTKESFRYRCKNVVLATGTTDSSNQLGIPGEATQNDWVIHDLSTLEKKLDELIGFRNPHSVRRQLEKAVNDFKMLPVLVVGAGLSAADAIMAIRFRGIPVLHAFRNTSSDSNNATTNYNSSFKLDTIGATKLQHLPDSIYPEYHKIYEMMADGGKNYPLYKALPNHIPVSLNVNSENDHVSKGKTVTLCTPNGELVSCPVSLVAIFIGSKPDLSYLEGSGISLGKIPNKEIDSKSNPIVVDDVTYEVLKAPRKGLYALGPLVGDNFVRFILGGAFGAFSNILRTLS